MSQSSVLDYLFYVLLIYLDYMCIQNKSLSHNNVKKIEYFVSRFGIYLTFTTHYK